MIAREVCRWVRADYSEDALVEKLRGRIDRPRVALRRIQEAGYLRRLEGMEGSGWDLTPKGERLVMASAGRPIHRATAEKKLNGLLERVAQVNYDPYFLYSVKQVKVFGSYLDDSKDRLGDIDVVIELVGRGSKEDFSKKLLQRANEAGQRGTQFRTFVDRLAFGELEVKRFLKGRSTALKIHAPDDEVLKICDQRILFSLEEKYEPTKRNSG